MTRYTEMLSIQDECEIVIGKISDAFDKLDDGADRFRDFLNMLNDELTDAESRKDQPKDIPGFEGNMLSLQELGVRTGKAGVM